MVNSTNYSDINTNSTNYVDSVSDGDVLLLEAGGVLLLESSTTDGILLENPRHGSTNFSETSINSTNYT